MTIELDILIGVIVALLGSGGMWAWLSSRKKSAAEADEISTRRAMTAMLQSVEFLKGRVRELDQDNITLRERVEKLEVLLETIQDERSTLLRKNLELCTENASLEKRLAELEAENERQRAEILQLHREVQALRARLEGEADCGE